MTRILYVEDNDDNVYALNLRFGLLDGLEVLIAQSGETGCAMALAEQPRGAGAFLDIDNPVLRAIARADFHAPSCAMRALVQ